ncbi:MAG: nucleotidyltransferase domain-containing protein [Chitinophagaceae bacterium]|jgi:predicted nucleotidyltransferase|nr:MAG: nucleotidyltransferase domain-containing protein [Chitinophagaceae bacterium]
MIPLVKDNLEKIRALCRQYQVQSLYLIGSAARKDKAFTDKSDVDLLYSFKETEISNSGYADNFFEFEQSLQKVLKTKKVDLVALDYLRNPYFITSIENDKTLLYEG